MSLSPGARLGPYEILSRLGAGGMGEVWKARDTRLDRIVAIKISAAQFSDRFMREARAVAALNHPNVCTLYDVGPNYLVMEYIEGESPSGPLPVQTVLDYARQIAAAMDAAHEKGIVHRDLKPANIRVTPQGVVKVLDFGLAKQGPASDESQPGSGPNSPTISLAATQAGAILGTASYMSPEQARGKPVDKRADIWAFGVVLYELSTGDRLFEGETFSDTLAHILVKEPDLSRLPPELDRLVRWCLEKDPAKRLRDIADARPLLDPQPAVTTTEEPTAAAAPVRTTRLWQAAAAAAALAALAMAAVHLREKAARPPEPFHFQLPLPENAVFTSSSTVVLSPDGRYVTFSGIGPEGPAVFVQDMDGGQARMLAGTRTGPQVPPFFWSPDSRYVVFSANSPKLERVDINSGAIQDICDKPGPPVGGSWNRDNTIIFGNNATGLWRVQAPTGKPVPLTHLNETRLERAHELPAFLPDGRHFLYLAYSSDGAQSAIYAASLDDPPGRPPSRILSTEFTAQFVPDPAEGLGWLLFLREGQLMAQTFDPRRLVLTGDPRPVPVRVGTAFQTALFSASPDLLVYRAAGSVSATQLTWIDAKTGVAAGRVGEVGFLRWPRLSPDETRVAYQRETVDNQSDVWVLDLARNSSTRLTFGDAIYGLPVWSPDGNEIAYLKISGGKGEIFKKRADGTGDEELVLETGESVHPTSWSNDGKYMLFDSSKSSNFTNEHIGALPLEKGAKPFLLSTGAWSESNAVFSPDGRYVAYASNETGRGEVYVRTFSPGPGVRTGGKWMVSSHGGNQPRWSPDGKQLLWEAAPYTIMSAAIDTANGFHAGVPARLYEAPGATGIASALTRRGQSLLVMPVEQHQVEPLNVLVNWTSTLNRDRR